MIEVSSSTKIDLPIEACWEKLRDLSLPHNYVPGVIDTKIVTDQKEGVGASRKVFMKNMPDGMDETVTDWQDGRGFTIRLHNGEGRAIPIFSAAEFEYRLEDAGDGTTNFRPHMRFQPRFGFNLLTHLVVKKKLAKTLAVIGQSLKEFYETGEPTAKDRIAEIQQMF